MTAAQLTTRERSLVAVIPGDGVGPEVIAEGVKVLRATGVPIEFEELPWGCRYFLEQGRMMPLDGLEVLDRYDAIYLGAVGWPSVPDHESLWGLLLPIRKRFELFANVRPVRLLTGIPCPLAGRQPADVDMLFFRENTEGEYSGTGGRVHAGTDGELAVEAPVFTRRAIERLARVAFEAARGRRGALVSVTKSNASRHAYVLWDEVIADVAGEYADVRMERVLVDAMAARMVLAPASIDVVIASNLFGDILTDLGSALAGGMGLGASANVDPARRHPSMFEPVHGSAPDIGGRGIANPIGAIWSGAMMLEHLGHIDAAQSVIGAIESVVASGVARTVDLGGKSSTREFGDAVAVAVSAPQ